MRKFIRFVLMLWVVGNSAAMVRAEEDTPPPPVPRTRLPAPEDLVDPPTPRIREPREMPTVPPVAEGNPLSIGEPCAPDGGKMHTSYLSAEAQWFRRRTATRENLSFFESRDVLALDTDDVRFDYEGGVRVTRGYWLSDHTSFELTYVGLHRWDSNASIRSPDGDLSSFFVSGFGPNAFLFDAFDQAFEHEVSYASELHSGEMNWLHQNNFGRGYGCMYLFGVRYIRYTEDFHFLSRDDPTPSTNYGEYTIETQNNLVGLQVGGELACALERARFAVNGKAGLLVNFADQHSTVVNRNINVRDATGSNSAVASLMEFGVSLTSRWGSHVEIRGGYQVMALGGLALAPEQIDYFAGINGQSSINLNGFMVMHGPFLGITINW